MKLFIPPNCCATGSGGVATTGGWGWGVWEELPGTTVVTGSWGEVWAWGEAPGGVGTWLGGWLPVWEPPPAANRLLYCFVKNALLSSFFWATATYSGFEAIIWPFMKRIASVASSTVEKQTNPNPLERPPSPVITFALVIVPNRSKSFFRLSSSRLSLRFFTYRFVPGITSIGVRWPSAAWPFTWDAWSSGALAAESIFRCNGGWLPNEVCKYACVGSGLLSGTAHLFTTRRNSKKKQLVRPWFLSLFARQSTTTKVNILWLNVSLISYWFSKVTFWTPSLVSWDLINALCTLFPCFIWHHQTVFGVMERTLGSSQFFIQVVEQRHEDCNSFCHQLFLLLWSKLLMIYCSMLSPQEKVFSGWVLSNPFFESLCLAVSVKMKKKKKKKKKKWGECKWQIMTKNKKWYIYIFFFFFLIFFWPNPRRLVLLKASSWFKQQKLKKLTLG